MKKLAFKQLLIINFSLIILFFAGCKKDKSTETPQPFGVGVFIVNQGQYGSGTGTISFFDRFYKTVRQDIFGAVNKRPLGNVVQSLSLYNSNAYIVVNNSGKVEVADASTFSSTGVINGLFQPRYFIGISPIKAYVSQWIDGTSFGKLAVINLEDNTIENTITVGHGPELMFFYKSKVFVLNTGGYGVDSTITVINSQTDQKINDINLFPIPCGICLDINNKIWVICSGGINGFSQLTDTYGHLVRINPDTYAIEKDLRFPSLTIHPFDLVINSTQDKLYYVFSNGIYKFSINDASLPANPLINLNYSPYALGYDYATGYIYTTDPLDNTQPGYFYRYDANTGAQIDYYKVGLIPGNFSFN
jgi:hypothetical protein